jgi:uncharacterized cupin superfamily protein
MVDEAKLARTETGLVPDRDGWFVLNAREARWFESLEFGSCCVFEGDARFPQLGINVGVLQPGQPACMYHAEDAQEDFLVLSGECLLLVEGQERLLKAWDFVHCPPWTAHVFVGAGTGPCVVVAVGARRPGSAVRYLAAEVARRHGAAVPEDTASNKEAYAPFSEPVARRYRDGDLPDR